jgi:hypothetical protein
MTFVDSNLSMNDFHRFTLEISTEVKPGRWSKIDSLLNNWLIRPTLASKGFPLHPSGAFLVEVTHAGSRSQDRGILSDESGNLRSRRKQRHNSRDREGTVWLQGQFLSMGGAE